MNRGAEVDGDGMSRSPRPSYSPHIEIPYNLEPLDHRLGATKAEDFRHVE